MSDFLSYKRFIRPLLFSFDSEFVHELVLRGACCARWPLGRSLLDWVFSYESPVLTREVMGLKFQNPVGLAAGFDKNGLAIELLGSLGFGHIEIGTVTPRPQPGNPKPRIFRMVEESGLINRMGFPSLGAEEVARRLTKLRQSKRKYPVIGVNIGKCRDTPLEAAAADYEQAFVKLADLADYITINVSSPNTPGLRSLQEAHRLREILGAIAAQNKRGLPIAVKLSPDLSLSELDSVLECCVASGVAAVLATNTTLDRSGLERYSAISGGVSGAPLRPKALEIVRHIVARGIGLPVIAVGGISSAQDARLYMDAGAELVQIYTGLIFEGPFLIKRLLRELAYVK